jgi:tripartite ATP-independent transporter DctM subunit
LLASAEARSTRASSLAQVLSIIDQVAGSIVESVAGVLVAVEIVVLLAGVASRYLFHRPLTWSDELASTLFLWLAMLGTDVAYRRLEHMRMAALIDGASARVRSFADALALMAGLSFLAMILRPSLEFAIEQVPVTMAALAISDAWRAAGLFVGVALMLLFGVLQLVRNVHLLDVLLAAAVIAIVGIALFAATGVQTETIPPSLVLITIGSVTGVSIAALFNGGMLPGLVPGLTLCGVVWWRARRDDTGACRPANWAETGWAFLLALPALALPVVIRAAVVEGVATATEVSTIGIGYTLAYALVVNLLFAQKMQWSRLWPALITTASLSGAILFIIGTATGMAWALTQSGFSAKLSAAMVGLPGGPATFLAASIAVFIVLGSVLEGIPAIVLFGPLMFPIARLLGINEVHYAMVVILAMGMGLFSPPFGVGYYAACAIGRVDPAAGMRAILPYLLAPALGLAIVAAFPWISTAWLR